MLWLLQNNRHKLTLSMKPDDKYSEKQAQMETEKLQQKVTSLSPEDKQQIYEKGQVWQLPHPHPAPPSFQRKEAAGFSQ